MKADCQLPQRVLAQPHPQRCISAAQVGAEVTGIWTLSASEGSCAAKWSAERAAQRAPGL